MVRLRLWMIVAATIALGAAASDIDIPAHNVDAACATLMRGHPRETHICVANEQAAYDWLKAVWPDVPDRVKRQAIAAMQRYEGNWFAGYYVGLQRAAIEFLEMDANTHPSMMPFRR